VHSGTTSISFVTACLLRGTNKTACKYFSNKNKKFCKELIYFLSIDTGLRERRVQQFYCCVCVRWVLSGTASSSSIEILERFQSKALRMVVDAPWYVPNTVIRRDLQTPTIKEEISRYSSQYSARLSAHPNDLIVNLMEQPDNRRLRRHLPNDLPTRFPV
jgi:hypothetical protein